MFRKIADQILCRVGKIILPCVINDALLIAPVRILFKSRTDHAHLSRKLLQQRLNQLRRPVSKHDVFFRNTECFCRQKTVDPHPRRILPHKDVKVRL